MYEELARWISSKQRLALIAHARPDGDAIGSSLGLALTLKELGKDILLWNEDGMPERFAFLEGAEMLQDFPQEVPAGLDGIICLDTGDLKRLGTRAEEALRHYPTLANIDHHGSNPCYGQVNLVEGHEAACASVVYKLLSHMQAPISRAAAAALYAGISTDTGSFQYPSTTPELMRIAADLMEKGIDIATLNREIYQEQPCSAIIVNKEIYNHMHIEEGGQLSHYSMSMETKQRLGINLEDTKDLVDIIRVFRGVKAAAIFEEIEDGRVRISLRSKDTRLSVADIAQRFGGGGHHLASGIRMRGSLEDCRERVLQALREALRALA